MAEGAKQFFVGLIHPRTWLAAILGIITAVILSLALGGLLSDFFGNLVSQLSGGAIPTTLIRTSSIGTVVLLMGVFSGAMAGSILPLAILCVAAVVAGLVFGATSKKERVGAKAFIGGFDLAIIYTVIMLIVYIVWWSFLGSWPGFSALYSSLIATLTGAMLVDIVVAFVVFWLVSAIIAMIVLSAKHD
jgi:hypothetical protein